MKALKTLALLAAVCVPSLSYAACNTCPAPEPVCNTCAPVAAPVCMEPVCKTCMCCPKIKGFLNW